MGALLHVRHEMQPDKSMDLHERWLTSMNEADPQRIGA